LRNIARVKAMTKLSTKAILKTFAPAAGGSLSPKWFAFFQAEWNTIGEYHKPPSRKAENAATRIAHGFKV
jgi:hypothetical protein